MSESFTTITKAKSQHQENLQALICPGTVGESMAELGHVQGYVSHWQDVIYMEGRKFLTQIHL